MGELSELAYVLRLGPGIVKFAKSITSHKYYYFCAVFDSSSKWHWILLGKCLSHSTYWWGEVLESCSSSGLWDDIPLSHCWLRGMKLVVDLICGSVCLSLARDLQPCLADVVFPWLSMMSQTHCISSISSFGFWLVVTPSFHCKVSLHLIMAGPGHSTLLR